MQTASDTNSARCDAVKAHLNTGSQRGLSDFIKIRARYRYPKHLLHSTDRLQL